MVRPNNKPKITMPSQREDAGRQAFVDAQLQAAGIDEKKKQLASDLNAVFSTEQGRAVLRYLIELCGFHKTSLALSPGSDVHLQSMVWNEARRELYVRHIRPFLHDDILIKAEITQGGQV